MICNLFICNVISKSTHFFSYENQLSIRLVLYEFNTEVLLLTFDLLDLYNMTHKLSCKNECITKTYSHLNYASAVSYTSLLDFKSLDPPFLHIDPTFLHIDLTTMSFSHKLRELRNYSWLLSRMAGTTQLPQFRVLGRNIWLSF